MASVRFDGITKVFPGGVQAVTGFGLEVRAGEFLVLVGPSGCGKSTVLRMLAGLETPTAGTISIDTRVVNDVEPKDRDIAMVFQNYALYPHMTVYDNLAFALRRRGYSRTDIDRRVRETAASLGIVELLSRRPGALSGGQRQRVAVGRAIVREPKVFLFDEPLSNLDAQLRVATRAELKVLHQRLRTTSIYVTHDQEEAMTLGHRIAVMCGGTLQQLGTPLEVYQTPANRFVAGFIGTPRMNFLHGILAAEATGLAFQETARAGRPFHFAVAGPHAATLAPHVGQPVVLGIRPQAIRDQGGQRRPSVSLTLPVGLVEMLGDSMDVTCTTHAGNTLVSRLPARVGLTVGAPADLSIDMTQAHYFEPGEFGRNLVAPPTT